MTGDDRRAEGAEAPVVETAAGTTSSANASSGKGPYVMAVGIVVLLGLLGSTLSSRIDALSRLVADVAPGSPAPHELQVDREDDYDDIDGYVEEYLQHFFDDEDLPDETIDAPSSGVPEGGTVADVLGSNLGMYQTTVDALLSASAYANAPESVRTCVRTIVLADRDASSELAASLRAAAWADEGTDEALADAAQTAHDTIATLRDIDLPDVEGDAAQDVLKGLTTGRDETIARWEAVAEELDLIAADGKPDIAAITEADEQVATHAQAAADAFAQALATAADR